MAAIAAQGHGCAWKAWMKVLITVGMASRKAWRNVGRRLLVMCGGYREPLTSGQAAYFSCAIFMNAVGFRTRKP
jgi:hypothetical protein